MRCPSCGTENAPDSRFCGGCGARLGASAQRLAPTQKISDDASFPPQRPPTAGSGHAVAQPGAGPRLVPAPYVPNGPVPQQNLPVPQQGSPPPRAISAYPASQATQRPPNGLARQSQLRPPTQLDDPSLSMPMVARRPWGLIILVLLLDLGLGAAGAWMLREGLGDEPGATRTAPTSDASATPTSAVAAGAQGASIEPRTAAASTSSPGAITAAPGAGSADPATGAAPGSATPGTGAPPAVPGAATPAPGSAPPAIGAATSTAAALATGAAAPASDPARTGATAETGSDAAAVDKPARRHRSTVKKPAGAAPTSGPVDPYATTAPRQDPLPRESK